MFGLPIAFASPWLLLGLVLLPAVWWLLRLTPPRPQEEVFPPTRILARLAEKEETPSKSPWWLTLLRLTMTALLILAMAGPVLNPEDSALTGEGPVLIVMDDGWASAQKWQERQNTALAIVNEAANAGRTVMLESTSGRENWTGSPLSPNEAVALVQAGSSLPNIPSHEISAERIRQNIIIAKPGHVSFLSDGLLRTGTDKLVGVLKRDDAKTVLYLPETANLIAMQRTRNEPAELHGTLTRADTTTPASVEVIARDIKGIVLARTRAVFPAGDAKAGFSFDQPVELRNQIARLEVDTIQSAGAVQLLDENNRRRLVGLISGEKHDLSQPLLSPLYYISRALEPFSDLRRADDANVAASVPDLLNQRVSAIVLADVGVLPEETTKQLTEWVEKGGMLLRFSGPRLAASAGNDLLPVKIRPGDRNLGGALSWEEPKALAPFGRESLFFGVNPPRDVLVRKQLLALQETNLEEKTWATLEDGTPLVTAEKRGNGWIVLFHVGSDASWSNLPLSGTFVEMLRRVVNLSRSSGVQSAGNNETALPPLRVLDGKGQFVAPDVSVNPLVISPANPHGVTLENPPGFYGTEDGFTALNLFTDKISLTPLTGTSLAQGLQQQGYQAGERFEFRIWLLVLATVLLLLDCLAVLWMAGTLDAKNFHLGRNTAAALAGAVLLLASGPVDRVQAQDLDFSAALRTRLAYVVTGVDEVDRLSEAGLRGLTLFLTQRTALEPAEPIGLDISADELSFYSLLYWPVDPRAAIPDAATMARIDAFMKEGGSILFDTRDQISGVFGGTSASPAARTLQTILLNLDIPPLEPLPTDHVLTKAFYLLDRFPGRFSGGELWVESSQVSLGQKGRPARAGDGVSSIMITSNDMAGAWAVDRNLRPLLPTVPPDPSQRNYAFRAGVNLMMYVLTGNYKADQVHLPALLERLGQ